MIEIDISLKLGIIAIGNMPYAISCGVATTGELVLTGKAADLKSAGSNPMGVRIPRSPCAAKGGTGYRKQDTGIRGRLH